MEQQNIAIVIYSLGRGGAEKVVSELSRQFTLMGHRVTIVLLDGRHVGYQYSGELIDLNLPSSQHPTFANKAKILFRRTVALRKLYRGRNFDKIIAFMESAAFPSILTGYATIVSNHCNPEVYFTRSEWLLSRLLYPFASYVVVVSRQGQKIFRRGLKLQNLVCIYNPIDKEQLDFQAAQSVEALIEGEYLVCVARLEAQKRIDRLLNAYAQTRLKENVKLLILGDGELRSELQKKINTLGLNEKVFMPGNVPNPFPYVKGALFLVLSSDHEGFPMVLIEALGLGKTAISTDCDTGPREIIQHGVNGLLVPVTDETALAVTMDELYENKQCQRELSKATLPSVEHLFINRIAEKWLAL